MPADLAASGIVLPDEHPDAELLALVANRDKRHDEWNAVRGKAAHLRLLAKWKKEGLSRPAGELIARFTP